MQSFQRVSAGVRATESGKHGCHRLRRRRRGTPDSQSDKYRLRQTVGLNSEMARQLSPNRDSRGDAFGLAAGVGLVHASPLWSS